MTPVTENNRAGRQSGKEQANSTILVLASIGPGVDYRDLFEACQCGSTGSCVHSGCTHAYSCASQIPHVIPHIFTFIYTDVTHKLHRYIKKYAK